MTNRHNQDSEETVNFFKEGVKQGIFRDDVNFAIINLLVREQIDVLMNTDICKEYSFLEVYESIMFTFCAESLRNRGRTSWKRLSGNTVKRLCLQTMTRKPNRITINSL